ncbi:unnamed protein product [Staurois parvus]|uniref:Uncharacterized protein n=1 Tax=Staurois parvus TaxID=386267 RepID=A0ABN9H2R1_9NEOB|nr:unnamed protein product [Staurois parvus]
MGPLCPRPHPKKPMKGKNREMTSSVTFYPFTVQSQPGLSYIAEERGGAGYRGGLTTHGAPGQ